VPTGVRSSERPFAHPQRLRLSAPPFRGQSSRPTPSNPNRIPPGPFGPSAPQPRLVRPSLACFNASDPLPDLRRSPSALPDAPTPLCGFLQPLGINAFSARPANEPACRIRPIPVRSPLPSSVRITDCGSSFPDRYVSHFYRRSHHACLAPGICGDPGRPVASHVARWAVLSAARGNRTAPGPLVATSRSRPREVREGGRLKGAGRSRSS
jgi:hypothetical protein